MEKHGKATKATNLQKPQKPGWKAQKNIRKKKTPKK